MNKYCTDCKIEVEGILYNDCVEPNVFICEECGQFISSAEAPKLKDCFHDVLNNCEDQVTVRRLLCELVPSESGNEIVRRFNERVINRWLIKNSI